MFLKTQKYNFSVLWSLYHVRELFSRVFARSVPQQTMFSQLFSLDAVCKHYVKKHLAKKNILNFHELHLHLSCKNTVKKSSKKKLSKFKRCLKILCFVWRTRYDFLFQSAFLVMCPILVRMLRSRKYPTAATPQTTSATQKAVSQPWCLAMVLNGRPDRKPPTEEITQR